MRLNLAFTFALSHLIQSAQEQFHSCACMYDKKKKKIQVSGYSHSMTVTVMIRPIILFFLNIDHPKSEYLVLVLSGVLYFVSYAWDGVQSKTGF